MRRSNLHLSSSHQHYKTGEFQDINWSSKALELNFEKCLRTLGNKVIIVEKCAILTAGAICL